MQALRKVQTIVLLPGVGLLMGCSSSDCPDIGCHSAAIVQFDTATWADGEYRIVSKADGNVIACALTVQGGKPTDFSGCDSGAMLYLALGNLRMGIPAAPPTFDVELELNGQVIESHTMTPSYSDVTPYAKECGPKCLEGHVTFE